MVGTSGEGTGVEIRHDRLADQAYEVLRGRILTRQLKPGDRLGVPGLSQELGLSRSPVREAVQRLVREGLCSERPRQGAVVASVDARELAELYQVRAVLEGLSAALATAEGGPALVADLRTLHDEQTAAFEAGDEAGIIRADTAFHGRLVQAAGNPELSRVLDPVLGRVAIAMLAGDLASWPAHALHEHEGIIAAVADGDPALARRRSEEHVLAVRSRLIGKLDPGAGNAEDGFVPGGVGA